MRLKLVLCCASLNRLKVLAENSKHLVLIVLSNAYDIRSSLYGLSLLSV